MLLKRSRLVKVLVCAVLAVVFAARGGAQLPAESAFARQIRELSEPGGSFDTDNLISNERSYLHVIPALKQSGAAGGAYIGVGPDQNFSYIAVSRPSVAYIIDVRRDNLLLQILFKALFEISDTRAEYLGHLFGRRLQPPPDQWRSAALDRIVAQIDQAQPNADDLKALHRQVTAQIAGFGLALSAAGSRHDPALPSDVHRRRPVAEIPEFRPRAAEPTIPPTASCSSKRIAPGVTRAF